MTSRRFPHVHTDPPGVCWVCQRETTEGWVDSDASNRPVAYLCSACADEPTRLRQFIDTLATRAATDPQLDALNRELFAVGAEEAVAGWESAVGEPVTSADQAAAILRTIAAARRKPEDR
jgi:hypothetical protein